MSSSGSVWAQETNSNELFVGYTYINLDPGIEGVESLGANGLHLEATRYLTERFGIAAEISGHFGASSTDIEGIDEVSLNQYSLLLGPRFRRPLFWKIELSSRALIGVSTQNLSSTLSQENEITLDRDGTETNLAIALGASLELRLNERVALRLIQSNRFYTFFGDDSQISNRYSSGILIRF